jgi:hypothetical protein
VQHNHGLLSQKPVPGVVVTYQGQRVRALMEVGECKFTCRLSLSRVAFVVVGMCCGCWLLVSVTLELLVQMCRYTGTE